MDMHLVKAGNSVNHAVANSDVQMKASTDNVFQFEDNRPETIAQKKLQRSADQRMHFKQGEKPAISSTQQAKYYAGANSGFARGPVAQRVTYALKHGPESEESFLEVLDDAQKISETQNYGQPLVKTADELLGLKKDLKANMHIVAHGNINQIGDFTDAALINHLHECGVETDKYCRIVLHSCDSGVDDQRVGQNQGTSLARRVITLLNNPQAFVVGMSGHVFTDHQGNSRVLRNVDDEDRYKELRNRVKEKSEFKNIEDKYLLSVEESQIEMNLYY
jgi:hypothetical protein